MNNNFNYIGYGFVASKKAPEDIDVKSTKAYKTLRAAFVDEITIEVGNSKTLERQLLKRILEEYGGDKNTVIVVPNAESLGGTSEMIYRTYYEIASSNPLIILDSPELSTCMLDGTVTNSWSSEGITEKLLFLRTNLLGRKAIPIDKKFRFIFWEWQNYYISTQEAIDLLEISRGTLYTLSKKYMTGFCCGAYEEEYYRLKDFENKPLRGVVLDDITSKTIVKLQRELGDNWTEDAVFEALGFPESFSKLTFQIPKDYIRLRLNYLYGRGAILAAEKKYYKGKEYAKKLKEKLDAL